MVLFNYSTKELTAKIVYYGPGLCGKTTNLQFVHSNLPDTVRGKMLSLATKTDRTLFFDFLPIDLGEIRGMQTRVQLYTVPGQVFYNETRKLVLKGADGIVFVADSQQQMLKANVESFRNLEENLRGHGLELGEMPHVIQFNKRDLPKLASIEEMNNAINKHNAPFYESVATTGIGVQDTLKAITKLVLLHLTRKYDPKAAQAQTAQAQPVAKSPTSPSPNQPVAPPVAPPVPAIQPTAVPAAAASSQPGAQPIAPASPMPAASVPLADPAPLTPPVAPVAAAPATPAGPAMDESSSMFGNDDIDSLVGDVEEVPGVADVASPPTPAPTTAAPVAPESMSVAVEPTADTDAPMQAAAEAVTSPLVEPEATVDAPAAERDETVVTLTEIVDDDELFDQPGLEVANVAAGETKEILVPVLLGSPDQQPRRFKLSIRLCLDPLD